MRIVFEEMSSWTPNNVSRDEDTIVDQIYKANMSGFYYDDF